jgi:hypothetical protein
MELRICVPFNSRNTAWASFDGRGRVELKRKLTLFSGLSAHIFYHTIEGDHIKVTASRYPFPTVCKEDQATDWFNSLQNCLHWNKRERQKSFAVVESHPTRHHKGSSSPSHNKTNQMLSQSPRATGFNPLSRAGTQSPPVTGSYHQQSPPNGNRKSSSSSSVSSDTGQDEVFGMFYDDDSGSDRYRPGGSNATSGNRRKSSAIEAESSASSVATYESTDEFESESDDNDYSPDGFTGWTDEEIIKSRYMANITKELERVSFKYTKTEAANKSENTA